MAELAYAHDSGSCPRKWVWVQVPSTASTYDKIKSWEILFPGSFFGIMCNVYMFRRYNYEDISYRWRRFYR